MVNVLPDDVPPPLLGKLTKTIELKVNTLIRRRNPEIQSCTFHKCDYGQGTSRSTGHSQQEQAVLDVDPAEQSTVISSVKSSFLSAAIEVLRDDLANPSLWVVAGVALSTAVNQGLAIPAGCAESLLKRLSSVPIGDQFLITEALGKLPSEQVRKEVLDRLQDPSTSDRNFDLLADAISGPAHSGYVSGSLVLDLCDRNVSDYKIKILASLIESISEAGSLDSTILTMIRDKWASSESSRVRETSIIVGRLLPVDPEFIRLALNDPSPRVRLSMAHELGFLETPNELVLDALAERIYVEENPEVLSALWSTQAAFETKK